MATFSTYQTQVATDHNRAVLRRAKKGDLLQFPRELYSHWALYVGDGRVIHLAGEPGDKLTAKDVDVREDSFWTVTETSLVKINNILDTSLQPLDPHEIVRRARERLGQRGYHLLFTNCEHFVTWCRYDKAISIQVDTVDKAVTAIGRELKTALSDIAKEHPNEEKRKVAENMLAVGEVLSLFKDIYFMANKNEQLNGLSPGQKY